MVPLLQRIRSKQESHGIPMERFYHHVGMTRQGFHKAERSCQGKEALMLEIESEVLTYRQEKDFRAGSRSLFYNLGIKERYGIGVNKFERLLSERGLSLSPLRVRVVTTRSSYQSWNYANLLNGLEVKGINEAVVGDLTYLNLYGEVHYLFCLTDVYSGRIVGYHRSKTMKASDAVVARDKWISLRGEGELEGCFHHTDGGSQYFSTVYLERINQLGIQVSRATTCLMNGYAEQRNGLIKNHFLPLIKGADERMLDKELECIFYIYNHERKQEGLGWLSPVEFEMKVQGMAEKPVRKLYKFEE